MCLLEAVIHGYVLKGNKPVPALIASSAGSKLVFRLHLKFVGCWFRPRPG